MAEADEESTRLTNEALEALSSDLEDGDGLFDADAPLDGEDEDSQQLADEAMVAMNADEQPVQSGPSVFFLALLWLRRWRPLIFLGIALGLAGYAWTVYPRSEARRLPPAEGLYREGLDRLYRVLNPDLPLVADTPADEAMAARASLLNLMVFYRQALRDYPEFINPHLLLAETARLLAEYQPAIAAKHWQEARSAYSEAALWENRDDDPGRMEIYLLANFLKRPDGGAPGDAGADDEIAIRRQRRRSYIDYRLAETGINLNRHEDALAALEDIRRREDGRRREELRLAAREEGLDGDLRRLPFELGPDEYRELDLLLGRALDGLGRLDAAKGWYLRYMDGAAGRRRAGVVERLADIAMSDGDVYRRVDVVSAIRHYETAAGYYRDLAADPSSSGEQRDHAALGLARSNSRLAELFPGGEMTGVDRVGAVGRALRHWLEDFSGQPLPRRTLGLPMAVGETLSRPEFILPGGSPLPGLAGGAVTALAGGKIATPYARRREYLREALENYDRLAATRAGTMEGERAAVMAAWESWNLGLVDETAARLERMLDPLASRELALAARVGLATVALHRGDLNQAHMLMLGGYVHPAPLWFTTADADWRKIAMQLGTPASREEPGMWRRLWDFIPAEGRDIAAYAASGRRLDDDYVERFLRSLNAALRRPDLYEATDFPPMNRNFFLHYLLDRNPELLTPEDVVWRNRLLLEESLPYDIVQRAGRGNIGFEAFPPEREIPPEGLVEATRVRRIMLELARSWADAARRAESRPETLRMMLKSNHAYRAALDEYGGDPGVILYELANNFESLAELRELQGSHLEALSLTAEAAHSYLDVSLKARGSPREMESLLAAGDAFFRAGLLGRAVESQQRFLERFGYSSLPGSEGALAVVRAENLLGRAYWFLKDTDRALESFRRNLARRTPDRYKSIYYIGRVLLEDGMAHDRPDLLGRAAEPLPVFDRNGDPLIETALQAFTYLRQSPDINPSARAWRWATFDLAKLQYVFAERARTMAEEEAGGAEGRPWLALYDQARITLTEALERYPLRRNGGSGLSVRVEPEDYADVMTARFETEWMLANSLLVISEAREDEALSALARAHLENLRDRARYAAALFDENLDRFQVNAAIIREEIEGGSWDRDMPLPRTRLGDDEGPTRSPSRMLQTLRNSMLLLGKEYFRAGERAQARQLMASAGGAVQPTGDVASGYYEDSYRVWQDVYDRFGILYGPEAMVNMGDCLNRLGASGDAANHYRMARNMMDTVPEGERSDGVLDIGPTFWGGIAAQRLQDMRDGYRVP